jgi:hypothetical protein
MKSPGAAGCMLPCGFSLAFKPHPASTEQVINQAHLIIPGTSKGPSQQLEMGLCLLKDDLT